MFQERQGEREQQGVSTIDAEHAVELMGKFQGFSGIASTASGEEESPRHGASAIAVLHPADGIGPIAAFETLHLSFTQL
jgi:hypothetical protein